MVGYAPGCLDTHSAVDFVLFQHCWHACIDRLMSMMTVVVVVVGVVDTVVMVVWAVTVRMTMMTMVVFDDNEWTRRTVVAPGHCHLNCYYYY